MERRLECSRAEGDTLEPGMSAFRFRHRIQVRFRDCDPMGHVNNAVYFTYLEAGRFAYWREMTGAKGGELPTLILARAECDFKKPARPGDWLDVWLGTTKIGRSSFTIDYEILDEAGQLVALAKSVQVMYDYEAVQSMPIPDWFRARIEQYEGRKFGVVS